MGPATCHLVELQTQTGDLPELQSFPTRRTRRRVRAHYQGRVGLVVVR